MLPLLLAGKAPAPAPPRHHPSTPSAAALEGAGRVPPNHAPPAPPTSILMVPLGPRLVFMTSYRPLAAPVKTASGGGAVATPPALATPPSMTTPPAASRPLDLCARAGGTPNRHRNAPSPRAALAAALAEEVARGSVFGTPPPPPSQSESWAGAEKGLEALRGAEQQRA